MNSLRCIDFIADSSWTRYEKYRVELSLQNAPKQVFWLSIKQMLQLKGCFLHTHENRSGEQACVYGIFDELREGKTYFRWCGVETPFRSDLPWLEKTFGVSKDPRSGYRVIPQKKERPVLIPDEKVVIPDDLRG